MWGFHPHDLITPQIPHLQVPSHWELRLQHTNIGVGTHILDHSTIPTSTTHHLNKYGFNIFLTSLYKSPLILVLRIFLDLFIHTWFHFYSSVGWKLYTALLIFNNLSGLQHDPLICQRQIGIGTVISCCTMKTSEQLYPFTVVLALGFLDGSFSNLLWHVVLFCQFIFIRFYQVWAILNHLNPISGFGILWDTWDLKLRGSLCEVGLHLGHPYSRDGARSL